MKSVIVTSKIRIEIKIPPHENVENIFLGMNLFRKSEFTKVKYHKSGIFHNKHCYAIAISFIPENFSKVFDKIVDELLRRKKELINIGVNPNEHIQFNFLFSHNGKLSWNITNQQLLKFQKFQIEPSFCFDSYVEPQFENSKLNSEYANGIDIFQLFFRAPNLSEIQLSNLKKSILLFAQKYKSISRLDFIKNEKYLFVLNIKEDLENFKWYDIYTDSLRFLKKNQLYYKQNSIQPFFGVYYSNTSGCGEFGTEFIREIIRANVDFIFSVDSYNNNLQEIPLDTISLPKQSLLFKTQ